MAETKKQAEGNKAELSPIEKLDQEHADAQERRKAAIAAAMEEAREADKLAREARNIVAALQQERLTASLAYDARRAELVAQAQAGAKAA